MSLNVWFEGRYAIAREAIEARLVAGTRPVIVRTEAELVLLHHGRRKVEAVLGPDYEHASKERDALEIAATYLLNRELGRFFMGSSVALQEDVLGEAAKRLLDAAFKTR